MEIYYKMCIQYIFTHFLSTSKIDFTILIKLTNNRFRLTALSRSGENLFKIVE